MNAAIERKISWVIVRLGGGPSGLRWRLGLRSSARQAESLWLEKLKAPVKEKRKFALALDILKKFDVPHRRVPSLAARVEELVGPAHGEQALKRIEQTRTGVLSSLLRLFADFRQVVRREIVVVLNGPPGIYVDSVAKRTLGPELVLGLAADSILAGPTHSAVPPAPARKDQ